MIEQITYVSFDDKDFINRTDCMMYEARMQGLLRKIKCWDVNLNPLPITDNGCITDLVDDLNNATERCFAIYIDDVEAARWCNDYFGSDLPANSGLFYYYEDNWIKADDIIKLADRLKELM